MPTEETLIAEPMPRDPGTESSASLEAEIEQLLNPPDPHEPAKLAAMIAPVVTDVSGFKFYPFNSGRLTLLLLAGIEKKLNHSFAALNEWLDTNKRTLPDLTDKEAAVALLDADPSACYHLAAVAFVCTRTPEELMPYRQDPATLEAAVFVWMDELADDVLWLLNFRSLTIYLESKTGEDFTVAAEGKPPDPNASTRAGSRSTAPLSVSTGLRKTGKTRSGAKSRSASGGNTTTPPSPCPAPKPSVEQVPGKELTC